jgi:hypothetical protein
MVAIELPLDIYDHFVGCCDPENPVTSILKSGTIVRRPNGERIAEISCQPDEAKTLLATATKICPNAVPFIERASRLKIIKPRSKKKSVNLERIDLANDDSIMSPPPPAPPA